MSEPTQAEIEAGARAINLELGCHYAECVVMDADGNCDCARVAKLVLEAARAVQQDKQEVEG